MAARQETLRDRDQALVIARLERTERRQRGELRERLEAGRIRVETLDAGLELVEPAAERQRAQTREVHHPARRRAVRALFPSLQEPFRCLERLALREERR